MPRGSFRVSCAALKHNGFIDGFAHRSFHAQVGDVGKASAVINSYFAPFNHKPTSTNIAVLELGELNS